MTSFLLALQFLTRIPVVWRFSATEKQFGTSVLFYPLIGVIIGGILLLCHLLLSNVATQIQAASLLTIWVLITGGLHLDGLADCADAWVGGIESKQRSLDIMKDPAAGPMAVIVLVLVLQLKWTAIVALLEQSATEYLFFIPVIGRCALPALMLTSPYVRKAGIGGKLVNNLPWAPAWIVLTTVTAITFFAVGASVLFAALAVLIVVRFLAMMRLGGATGDVYGAAVELVEVAMLVTAGIYVAPS